MAGNWPGSGNPEVFQIGIRETSKGLVDEPGKVWGRVQDIFTEFCQGNMSQGSNKFKMASALWLSDPVAAADIQPHEVVVYLLKDSTKSLIARNFASIAKGAITANTYALTLAQAPKRLSEVYCEHPMLNGDPVLIANAIIHELMHNKLNMNDDMHDLASGIGGAGGFLQDNVARYPKLTTSGVDTRTMAPALGRVSTQFLA